MAITLTRAKFVADRPEFKDVAEGVFAAASELASAFVPENVWGETKGGMALSLLTAHVLCIAPNGEKARLKLDAADGAQVASSTYFEQFKLLRATLGPFMNLY